MFPLKKFDLMNLEFDVEVKEVRDPAPGINADSAPLGDSVANWKMLQADHKARRDPLCFAVHFNMLQTADQFCEESVLRSALEMGSKAEVFT